ncbi:MAG TPA: hypothetical protein VG308_07265 [Stellaceae bacterium]|nr:hypothetical protein [Stellaceae bacterium]
MPDDLTVWMSIIGAMAGWPPIQVSRAVASAKCPSTAIPISAEVPPTSKVISRLRPDNAPLQVPPRTPAAGPDSKISTGLFATVAAVATPPFEHMTWRSPAVLVTPSPSSSRPI